MTRESPGGRVAALSDFQRATAQHAFRRLYLDEDSSRRFLVADETGLGKTHVAKEVIALTLEHLQRVDHVKRIDIVYVCSNADIARQNIRKLTISGSESPSFATRLSLLITQPDVLTPAPGKGKPATFVAFTPATSFQFGLQMGTARERAVLYVLLRDHLGLRGARATAAERIFQGGVTNRRRFIDWYVASVRARRFEPSIHRTFLEEFDESPERASLVSLIGEVAGRRALTGGQRGAARVIVGALRRMLARAAVRALEPDLVILDEFQRFRNLLDVKTGGEAAELAHDFFTQSDAHVLLLSATPYKPFTYAEETAEGAGHYEDFLKTLEFLAASEGPLDALRSDLDALRQAALSGEPTAAIRDRVQARLRRWIARTERPAGARRTTTLDMTTRPFGVRAEDFSGWVALKRVADEVRGPLSVEYWKSSPYFLNFLSGYRVGERVRDHMKVPDRRARLMPLFRGAQRIARSDVEGFQPLEWANARMRALAAETLEQGWWRLLWMPPSLPYHSLGGPYESVEPAAITKQLIFSSWVAAPSAIASLLSYEVQRRIFAGSGPAENTPAARAAISSRLDYRTVDERPASMSVLALFWPQPALASRTDPLDAAREEPDPPSVERLLEWARGRVGALVGRAGETSSTASAAWYWFAPVRAEQGRRPRIRAPRGATEHPGRGPGGSLRRDAPRVRRTCRVRWTRTCGRCSGPSTTGHRSRSGRRTCSRRARFSEWGRRATSRGARSTGCGGRTTGSPSWGGGVRRRSLPPGCGACSLGPTRCSSSTASTRARTVRARTTVRTGAGSPATASTEDSRPSSTSTSTTSPGNQGSTRRPMRG